MADFVERPIKITWCVPNQRTGGVVWACHAAAKALSLAGPFHCTVLSLYGDEAGQHSECVNLATLGLSEGERASTPLLSWLHMHPQDVLISNDIPDAVAAFPHIPPKTAHIVQVHDTLPRYRKPALNFSHSIDGVLCVAEHIARSLAPKMRRRGFTGPVESIHNCAFFPPYCERPTRSGAVKLLFMGRLDPLKGVYDLVPLLRQISTRRIPFQLSIVGGHNPALKHAFEKFTPQANVSWLGLVSHDHCFELAAESDVFLMLSHVEAFGLATIETMAMGCVPLAYDIVSGSREIIEHGKNGFLLPAGRFDVWARTIEDLQRDNRRFAELSSAAARRARTAFSPEAIAAGLADYIRRIHQNHARSAPNRLNGVPVMGNSPMPRRSAYQLLPARLRLRLRNALCRNARFSNWVLRHWPQ